MGDLLANPHYGQLVLTVGLGMHSLNGLFNALTYVCVFYGIRRLANQQRQNRNPNSLNASDLLGIASFHVSFGDVACRCISADTRQANVNARLDWPCQPGASPIAEWCR